MTMNEKAQKGVLTWNFAINKPVVVVGRVSTYVPREASAFVMDKRASSTLR